MKVLRVFCISIILLSYINCSKCYLNTESEKYWMCTNEDYCVQLNNKNETNKITFPNQENCRLSCGKYGSVWPKPTIESLISSDRVYFDPDNVRFNIAYTNSVITQYLSEVNRLFIKNIKKECYSDCKLKNGKEIFIKVSVTNTSVQLDWNTNESYKLTITSSDRASFVEIKANTIYGARHGMETLSNLITAHSQGLVMVANARIEDAPIFKHRGLLLDTARNYFSVRAIKRILDGMATSKLNVFHWHATDTHSFPIEIKSVPQLQNLGAYSPEYTYSHGEMQHIVQYAKQRGIRVLIELDGPSHAGNGWQFGPESGLGDLSLCLNQQPWRKFCIQPPCGQLNPINENVYLILKKVFTDLSKIILSEETIHMGGDEVHLGCWNASIEILNYLKKKKLNTSEMNFYSLWSEFHKNNLNSWDEINSENLKPVIIWSSHLTDPEVIEKFLPKDRYIIQTWVESELPLNLELIKKGYKIIVSTKNAWYLDHGFWGKTQYYNWRTVYDNNMLKNKSVLGGEVCMWSEYVDENSLDARVWPRAGAAAERLWSDPNTKSYDAEQRFNIYRERLIARGIQPDAIMPKWCVLNEGQCF